MRKKVLFPFMVALTAILLLGCPNPVTPPTDTVINIVAIPGVTAPVLGATPVTAITETAQYTGTVAWNGTPATFAASTVYTATITLTAKAGFTLTGVAANSFTVAGATATNAVNSGVVTAVFPATGAAPDTVINIVAIPGVTAPVAGETPVTETTETDQYTGTVSWSPSVSGTFEYSTVYTATITLTAKAGYTLTGVPANFFTVSGADSVTHDPDSGKVTAVFPADFEYAIGDTGPAGGLIFYIDEADAHTWTYLEAAPRSTEWQSRAWGVTGESVNDNYPLTGIGDGQAATTLIVDHMEERLIEGTAAQLCDALSHNGFEDWFLPSKDELNAIWENLVDDGSGNNSGVGGFDDQYHWSSNNTSNSYAWGQHFYDGSQSSLGKGLTIQVRAVRAF